MTSPPTAKRIVAVLSGHGAYAGTPPVNTRGPLYRLAIRQALASDAARVHYLDLDRALHWIVRAPRELRAVLELAERRPSLLIGRAPRAHRSHHGPLYATETVTNAMFARRLGIVGRVDFLVPSFVVTRHGAMRLLVRSRARDAQIYGEWTALLAGLERRLAYVECRGLEWETPDRHRRAVARLGLAAWRRRMETPDEWVRRLAMAREFQRGFEHALRRHPVRRPRLVRCTL